MTSSATFVEPTMPRLNEIVGSVYKTEHAEYFWCNIVNPEIVDIVHQSFDGSLDLGWFLQEWPSIVGFDVLQN